MNTLGLLDAKEGLPLMFWRTEMIFAVLSLGDRPVCICSASVLLKFYQGSVFGETSGVSLADKTDTLLGVGRTSVPNKVT